jgi:hypothetical protein
VTEVNVIRIILAIVGASIVADGIGSILLQRRQAWYWQLERVVRSIAGMIVLFIALVL